MEKTNQDRVVRAAHRTMRSLGSIVGISCNLVRDTGKFIGSSSKIMTERSSKMLDRFSKIVKPPGKKIAGLKLRRAVAVRDSLGRAVEESALVKDSRTEAVSETSALEPDAEEATVRPRAMRALVTALESDITAVRRELAETQSQAEKTQSQLTSQLKALQAEKESLISELAEARNKTNEVKPREDAINEPVTVAKSKLDAPRHKLEKANRLEKDAKAKSSSDVSAAQMEIETTLSNGGQKRAVAVPVEEKVTSSMEATAEADEKMDVRIEGSQIQPLVAEAEAPKPVDVTLEEVKAADLPNASEKIIFAKALSDIISEDASVRIDAVKIITGIQHKLSVRALAAQMAHEPSAQVQQECIKGLMTLQMTEGLPAVERALTDRAAPVRLAAVWGLYRLAGAESAPALIHMFSDEDEDVRRRAVTCIGWLGKAELAAELLPLLDDSSVSVRRAAVETMGNLRCRQVVSALIEHLNDPAESIRKAALITLKTITGKKMSGPFPKNAKSLERLIARWREWWKEQRPG